jgi:hypothetical protein
MSQPTVPAPEPTSRPTLADFFLLLAGASLSLYLVDLAPLAVQVSADVSDARARAALVFLAGPLRLGEGVVLLWPLFFYLQRLRGRAQGLTAGEWLWVLSWVGVALLAALDVWRGTSGVLAPSDFILQHAGKARVLWYRTLVPALAVVAGALVLAGLFRRRPAPWTHALGLALLIWPALPLAAILAFGSLG